MSPVRKPQKHLIKKQNINLRIIGVQAKKVRRIQDEIVYLYRHRLADILDSVFSRLVPPDVHITIDRLDIDLGKIKVYRLAELQRQVESQFKRIVEQAVRKAIREKVQASVRTELRQQGRKRQPRTGKLGLLEGLLREGHYPAWAGADNPPVQKVFEDLLRESPASLVQLIRQLRRQPRLVERLAMQFEGKALEKLIMLLQPQQGKRLLKQLKLVRQSLVRRSKGRHATRTLNQKLYMAGLEVLLGLKKGEGISDKVFMQETLERAQKALTSSPTAEPLDGEGPAPIGQRSQSRDLEILEHFLSFGSLPAWAGSATERGLQVLLERQIAENLLPLRRMLERRLGDANFRQRLLLQFDAPLLLGLLEPLSNEASAMLSALMEEGERLFSTERLGNRARGQSLRREILDFALDYVLLQKQSRFEPALFLEDLAEGLGQRFRRDYSQVLEGMQAGLTETELPKPLRQALSQMLDNQGLRQADQEKSLAELKTELQNLQTALKRLQDSLNTAVVSPEGKVEIRAQMRPLRRRLAQIRHRLDGRKLERVQDLRQELEQAGQARRELSELEQIQADKIRQALQQGRQAEKQSLDLLLRSLSQEGAKPALRQEVQSALARYRLEKTNLQALLQKLRPLAEQESPEAEALKKEQRRLRREIKRLDEESKTLEKALEQAEKGKTDKPEDPEAQARQARLDFMLFVLQYGSIPWWAAEEYRDTSIQKIFEGFLDDNPEQLRQALLRSDKHPAVWRRLVNQLSPELLERSIRLMYSRDADYILMQAEAMERIQWAEVFPQLKKIPARESRWSLIFDYLFNANNRKIEPFDLSRDFVIGLDQEFDLPAEELLGYFQNLSRSYPQDFGALAKIVEELREDSAIKRLFIDRRKAEARRKGKALDLGEMSLSHEERLQVLDEYLSTGTAPKAKENPEQALTQLIDRSPKALLDLLLQSHLPNPQARLLILNLRPNVFWDLVQLLRPKALPLAERYFKDLRRLGLEELALRDELLLYILRTPQPAFEINAFIEGLIQRVGAESRRQTPALINDWKRRLAAAPQDSGLLLLLMDFEIQPLRQKMELAEDEANYELYRQQVESLEAEYNQIAQNQTELLQMETVESEGVPPVEASPAEIAAVLQQLDEAMATVQAKLEAGTNNFLDLIQTRQQLAALKAQKAILDRKYPAMLRLRREELLDLAQNLEAAQARRQSLAQADAQRRQDLPPASKILPEPLAPPPALILWADSPLTDSPANLTQVKPWLDRIEGELTKAQPQRLEDLGELLETLSQNLETLKAKAELSKVQSLLLGQGQRRIRELQSQIAERLQAQPGLQGQIEALDKEAFSPQIEAEISILLSAWQDGQDLPIPAELPAALQTKLQKLQAAIREKRQTRYRARWIERQKTLYALFKQFDSLAEPEQAELDELAQSIRQVLQAQQADYDKAAELLELPDWPQRQTAYLARLNQSLQTIQKHLDTLAEQEEQALKEARELLEAQIENILESPLPGQEEAEAEPTETPAQPEKTKPERKKPEIIKPVIEPLLVKNAGMILLWPYYSRLFSVLEYIEKNNFVSEEAQLKAAHILQFIVTSETETPENEMVLNKILCNIPLATPIPLRMDFTEDELETAESLLQGAINNWSKMNTMSPGALRGTFLNREGSIMEESDRWKLKIEKGTFDMILRTIPWGFTFVKFPWMSKPLMVEWNY